MKLAVFYDHILQAAAQSGKSVQDILRICCSAGIEAVEMNYTYLRENYENVRQELRQASMKVSCICEFFDWGHNSGISDAQEMIQAAVDLGAQRVLVIPGFLNESDAKELNSRWASYEATAEYMENHPQIQNMKKVLTDLASYASSRGVTVTLEDFDGGTAPFARTWQLLWFMKQVPEIGYTLDMGNFAYSDEDVLAAYEILGRYIVHVHCKDRGREPGKEIGNYNKGMGIVPVGRGYIPIAELLGKLKEQKYGGYLTIEHFNAPDQMTYIQESAKFIQSNLV